MKMKTTKLFALLVALLALCFYVACDGSGNGSGCDGTPTPTPTPAPTATPTPTPTPNTNPTPTPDPGTSIEENSTIRLNGNAIVTDSGTAIVNGARVTLTAPGTYTVSGALTDGQIIVAAPKTDKVTLVLNGVNIKCSTSSPIFVQTADKVIISLADNTQNTLTDGSNYVFESAEEDEPNAALFSKEDLTIKGNGALTVYGNYNDGITSKDDLKIKSGTLQVTAVDDGIRGKDSIEIEGGVIKVHAGGDGLKSDNDEDTAKGYVSVAAGELEITAGGDGIAAETNVIVIDGQLTVTTGGGSRATLGQDVSAKGLKGNLAVTIDGGILDLDCADDGIHSNGSILINAGAAEIATGDDGVHADVAIEINGGDLLITRSYEAVESASITVNGGNIRTTSSDDGFNVVGAGGGEVRPGQAAPSNQYLHINGGYIAVNANGDGLDANGAIEMTGGTVIVHGPTANNNGALDYNSFKITGGIIVAVGSSGMAQAAGSTASSQNALLLNFSSSQAAGRLINIQNSAGQSILTFAPVKAIQSITFSSPDLIRGSSYRVYTGGSASGTVTDGLYQGGSYTAGTQYTTFTVSSAVTQVGAGGGIR